VLISHPDSVQYHRIDSSSLQWVSPVPYKIKELKTSKSFHRKLVSGAYAFDLSKIMLLVILSTDFLRQPRRIRLVFDVGVTKMLYDYNGIKPRLNEPVFIADGVRIIGDVSIGQDCSVWYNAVLRGDLAPIQIGRRSNIQDGTIGHVNLNQPLIVGEDVSVGHGAIIHGCTIGRGALIGMGAIILNGAVIGDYALIGAGAVVTENKIIPSHTLSLGSPARVVRELTVDDLNRMKITADSYVQKGKEYAQTERGEAL
jgi:carbonic anhydrase/acetyltransferase-like protein (isoleucine patch superfamily)